MLYDPKKNEASEGGRNMESRKKLTTDYVIYFLGK